MSEKKFFSYDEQLNLLERKGLEIPDRDEAIRLLKEHSYFDLINGYKYPFKKRAGTINCTRLLKIYTFYIALMTI